MADLVFFYGTLMTGFQRRNRIGIDEKLRFVGHGAIQAALFDLGIYPAAIPDPQGRVWGEVFEIRDRATVLPILDEMEGHRPGDPQRSLYNRVRVPVVLEDGAVSEAWVYFYNAPLGQAPRIASGDYLEHVKVR